MIFAKVDVLLPRHHRMQAIDRASALGVYVAALCYSREHELDGFVPLVAFRGFPSHQKRDIDELVRVGLFESAEREGAKGVQILRYGDKNETKGAIEQRRAVTRERVTRFRKQSNGVTHGEGNASVPGSLSGSVVSESLSLVACPDDLPAEWRASAEMLGVRDVPDAWAKFHLLLKSKPRSSANWASEWELFYRREKTFQAGGRGATKREVQNLQGDEPWMANARKAGF